MDTGSHGHCGPIVMSAVEEVSDGEIVNANNLCMGVLRVMERIFKQKLVNLLNVQVMYAVACCNEIYKKI